MQYHLRLTAAQYEILRHHLFPPDGKEAVALLFCGRRNAGSRYIFTVREVHAIPHHECIERTPDRVRWSTDVVDQFLEQITENRYAVVKIHSHRVEMQSFSSVDDDSDAIFYSSLASLLGNDLPHATLVMTPSGAIIGRAILDGTIGQPLSSVMAVGDDISIWHKPALPFIAERSDSNLRNVQAFGLGTVQLLQSLAIAVVGCSGTGSFVVEELARLGVGRLVLIDPDCIEEKNLNRILNSSKEDSYLGCSKVQTLARAIARMGFNQEVCVKPINLLTADAIGEAASCDVVFGCMDTVEGRHVLNRLATFYSMPYFDVGVRLDADGKGGIEGISGAVHYLQPGGSSLLSRGVYSMSQVDAEGVRRTNPHLCRRQQREGYLRGIQEDRPAVVSVNGIFASLAVQELLARLHPYRNLSNRQYAYIGANLSEVQFHREAEGAPCELLRCHAGKGDISPPLGIPGLSA